jgi:hypothetical protein
VSRNAHTCKCCAAGPSGSLACASSAVSVCTCINEWCCTTLLMYLCRCVQYDQQQPAVQLHNMDYSTWAPCVLVAFNCNPAWLLCVAKPLSAAPVAPMGKWAACHSLQQGLWA